MIFAGNFKTHGGSSKKGAGKKGGKTTSYSGNFDWLLGYAPIVWCGTVWRNKDDYFPAFVSSQTFTSALGNSVAITNSPGTLLGIVSVQATIDVNQTFNDFGSAGPVTIAGQQQIPLYPHGQTGNMFDNIAPGGFDFSSYPPPVYRITASPRPTSITLLIAGYIPTIVVDGTHPLTVVYLYAPKSKTPLQQAKLVFENELGNGNAFSFPNGATYQVIYPEFAGISAANFDMGTGNSAPNDNFEVQGLYAYGPNGDANPADAILDVILSGNPPRLNGQSSGYAWGHGLGFGITLEPQGLPQFPNVLFDPPDPSPPPLPGNVPHIIQFASGSFNNSSTSQTLILHKPCIVGHFVFIFVATENNVLVRSTTDDGGNSPSDFRGPDNSGATSLFLFGFRIVNVAQQFTIAVNSPTNFIVSVFETNANAINPLPQDNFGAMTNAATAWGDGSLGNPAPTVTTFVPTLLVSLGASEVSHASFSNGAGWVALDSIDDAPLNACYLLQYQPQTSPGTYGFEMDLSAAIKGGAYILALQL